MLKRPREPRTRMRYANGAIAESDIEIICSWKGKRNVRIERICFAGPLPGEEKEDGGM